MNRPTLEKDIKKDVQRELIKLGIYSASEMGKHKTQPNGWYYMPVQSGMGTSKIADFIGHYKGFFWAIETKAPGKKCTGLQEWIGQRIIESGAVWFVVDGEESFKKFKLWVDNLPQRSAAALDKGWSYDRDAVGLGGLLYEF